MQRILLHTALFVAGLSVPSLVSNDFAEALAPGYEMRAIRFPDPFQGAAALAFSPDGILYVAEGKDFLEATNLSTIWAVDPAGMVLDMIPLAGDDRAGGGNISIGGMAVHPITGQLLVTDNAPGARTLYAVDPQTKFKSSLASFVDLQFIDDVAVRATGEIVVTNAAFQGEIFEVHVDTSRISLLARGLETSAGIAFDSGGNIIYQQAVITSLAPFESHGEILRFGIDDSGPALAVTARTQLADNLSGTFDVAVDSEDDIFVTGAGGLFDLDRAKMGVPPLAESNFEPGDFATEVAFLAGDRPFEPFAGPSAGMLAYIPSFNSPTVVVITPAPPRLRAGDANQDRAFDQLDLVQVQQANKYLTGSPATWGEGDWNGAPGGQPGNPPEGDGLFDQRDLVAALVEGTYLTGPYAATRPESPLDDDLSQSISKATFSADFGRLELENSAEPAWSPSGMLGEPAVGWSLTGGGASRQASIVNVPEPAAIVLLVVSAMALLAGYWSFFPNRRYDGPPRPSDYRCV